MSLRQSPTMTPARLAGLRSNGDMPADYTAPSITGGRAADSLHFESLRYAYFSMDAPFSAVLRRKFITPEMRRHALFAEAEEVAIAAEMGSCGYPTAADATVMGPRGEIFFAKRSRNVIDSKGLRKG